MIYLDNAATTYPKPPSVTMAVSDALRRYGANPGRGGHPMAMATAEQVFACREEAAVLFGASDPTHVIFTANCTAALNTVIHGLLKNGGHAVISDLEHNAVIRPLSAIAGVTFTEAEVTPDDEERTLAAFRRAIRPQTRLILCTHASNVTGTRLPIRRIGALAHEHGIPFAVDAAQSAGVLPIDLVADHVDFLCAPGHKGLYGPMGTGLLVCGEVPLAPLMQGGTGSASRLPHQPSDLPDRLESGTLGVPGICGLFAGLRFVRRQGVEAIAAHEAAVMCRFYDVVAAEPTVRLYTERPDPTFAVPLVTLNVEGLTSEQTAARLADAGVAVRAGLHCAPSAHRRLGTLRDGAVRFCPSRFTTVAEAETAAKILCKIARKTLHSTV